MASPRGFDRGRQTIGKPLIYCTCLRRHRNTLSQSVGTNRVPSLPKTAPEYFLWPDTERFGNFDQLHHADVPLLALNHPND
jgi:hypothetical protein